MNPRRMIGHMFKRGVIYGIILVMMIILNKSLEQYNTDYTIFTKDIVNSCPVINK